MRRKTVQPVVERNNLTHDGIFTELPIAVQVSARIVPLEFLRFHPNAIRCRCTGKKTKEKLLARKKRNVLRNMLLFDETARTNVLSHTN